MQTLTRKKGQPHSQEFIQKLLEEADRTSVHGTAIRNGVTPAQLFAWRKLARLTADADRYHQLQEKMASMPVAQC